MREGTKQHVINMGYKQKLTISGSVNVINQPQVGYQEVTQCKWPDHITTGFISKLPDGSTRVTSVDGLASLTLMPHRQTFVARFLAEVKYSLPQVKSFHFTLFDT